MDDRPSWPVVVQPSERARATHHGQVLQDEAAGRRGSRRRQGREEQQQQQQEEVRLQAVQVSLERLSRHPARANNPRSRLFFLPEQTS